MKEKQPTREKILDVVYALVYIHGYNGTSMSMILKECGIPKGSLYHFFKSKKEMVLAVLKERIAPSVYDFHSLQKKDNEDGLEIIIDSILKTADNLKVITYGCPLNRLNQEMSVVDTDFENEISLIYEKIKKHIKLTLDTASLKQGVDRDSLADYVILSVWGALSLPPKESSKERYLTSISHTINYLKSLEK